jgi:glycine/serine hydroxymethyltransferase
MADILDNINDEKVIADAKQKVLTLCKKYPVYPAGMKF